MQNWFYRRDTSGLIRQILLIVGLAVVGNGIIFATGLNSGAINSQVPAGWEWLGKIVAGVWVVLFACMATARWLVLPKQQNESRRESNLIFWLVMVCWLYPYYTLGFREVLGLIANVLVIGLTIFVIAKVRKVSKAAAALVALVTIWICIATIYVLKLIQ